METSKIVEISEEPSDANIEASLPQIIKSVSINKMYGFAGEVVPQDDFDAIERLDRELAVNSYYHSSTLLNIKAANRYFPTIERILAENGVPDDFKYLAVAESGLRNAVSPAGAKGYWQFLKAVGEQYGLEINGEVDERFHLEKSTLAACNMIKDYYRKFGNWTTAAGAYNMGIGNMSKMLDEQNAKSYYELNVNEETSRYIFRIIAIKEVLSNPQGFGFYLEDNQLYEPLDYVNVNIIESVSSWGEFAEKYGTSYRHLKVYNPWLISKGLTYSGNKEYQIRIPKK